MLKAKVEYALAAVAGVLTVLTLVWPTWIESLFGAAPDAGGGEAEWLVALVFAAAAVTLGLLGRRHVVLAQRAAPDGA
ncbi:MAG: hypothetical protein ACR2LI_17375 [Propionibacteriaceae bacterium]